LITLAPCVRPSEQRGRRIHLRSTRSLCCRTTCISSWRRYR